MIAAWMLLSLFFAPQQTVPRPATPSQSSRSYRISGVVVDSVSGSPVSRAEVSIADSSGGGEEETIHTTDGTFSFDGVQPGRKYRLSAVAPGYVSEGYNQHQGFFSAIAVGDAFDSENLVFRLRPQAVIYGTVTDEHGEPVRHAQIMLVSVPHGSRGPYMQGNAATNDLGQYRISRLSPGKYVVMVQASPWYAQSGFKFVPQMRPDASVPAEGSFQISVGLTGPTVDPALDVVYPITFYPSATDAHDAEEIQIAAGEKREADISLAPVPAAHIRVTNIPIANNSPNGNSASVNFQVQESVFGFPIGNAGVASAYLAPGEYEISGVPATNAILTINQYGPERRTETIQANLSSGTIDASAATAAANISGQVTFPGGAPPSLQGNVFLVSDRRANYSARLHKDGTFVFDSAQILPGTYRVGISLNNGGGQNYVQQISATGANVSGRDIMIDSAASIQLTVSVGHGLGQISGVAQLDGKPLSGAMVLLIPESGSDTKNDVENDYRQDQTNTDGTFALGRIIPGKYLLMAIKDGWDLDWRDPQALAPFREKAEHLEIAPGQEQKVTVVAQPATRTSSQAPSQ